MKHSGSDRRSGYFPGSHCALEPPQCTLMLSSSSASAHIMSRYIEEFMLSKTDGAFLSLYIHSHKRVSIAASYQPFMAHRCQITFKLLSRKRQPGLFSPLPIAHGSEKYILILSQKAFIGSLGEDTAVRSSPQSIAVFQLTSKLLLASKEVVPTYTCFCVTRYVRRSLASPHLLILSTRSNDEAALPNTSLNWRVDSPRISLKLL